LLMEDIVKAKEHLGKLLEEQFARIEQMKENREFIDYNLLDTIKIGIVGGGRYWTFNLQNGTSSSGILVGRRS